MKKFAALLLMTAATMLAELPMSKELKQGDVSIVLGVYSAPKLAELLAVPEARLLFQAGSGIHIMVKTDNPLTTRYNVTVLVKTTSSEAGYRWVSGSTARYSTNDYTLMWIPVPGGFDSVADVFVDESTASNPASRFSDQTMPRAERY
jgi:hypothetical protein